MTKQEIKETLEKQLQLLSERSENPKDYDLSSLSSYSSRILEISSFLVGNHLTD